ncbi:hypothetical protein J0H58_01280 [bacterium]|nr:hypothetical protein [bacterium]
MSTRTRLAPAANGAHPAPADDYAPPPADAPPTPDAVCLMVLTAMRGSKTAKTAFSRKVIGDALSPAGTDYGFRAEGVPDAFTPAAVLSLFGSKGVTVTMKRADDTGIGVSDRFAGGTAVAVAGAVLNLAVRPK